MKQFKTIFSFEYLGYFRNKVLIGLTLFIVIGMGILLFSPRITHEEKGVDIDNMITYSQKIALKSECEVDAEAVANKLVDELGEIVVEITDKDEETLKADIENGEYDSAVIITAPLKYIYLVENIGLTDITTGSVNNAVTDVYRETALKAAGLNDSQVEEILGSAAEEELHYFGNDNTQSFFYTYILMFLMYMAVIIYGQFVSQSVALEKSSRAMELLITSAKPVNLMFGKILGAGAMGLTQILIILGSAVGFYALNKQYWQDNMLINSIFGMPAKLMVYTVVFFVLGFLLYAFMYGALASMATKLEDVNTLTLPVTFIMIITFMVTMFSMTGNTDNVLLKVASFIPFSAPMAMFTRIAMGSVSGLEITISIAVLVITTVVIGYIAAGIYKVGVLMYGKPPKLNEIFRVIENNKVK
ncbi:MAG: ABC transporter permease [Clostridiaceae bacterium]|nr:ABC transporter permease [Clostridiaceae bacterium]